MRCHFDFETCLNFSLQEFLGILFEGFFVTIFVTKILLRKRAPPTELLKSHQSKACQPHLKVSEYPFLQVINISDARFLTLVGRRSGVVWADIVCEDAVTAEKIRARVAADDGGGGREVECTVMSACAEEAIFAVKF